MTPATATKARPARSVSTELDRLERANRKAHDKARAARELRDAWDLQTQALRQALDVHLAAHPDQAEGTQRRPRPDTEAARLHDEIVRRSRADNPHQADYEAARDAFHAHDAPLQAFKRGRVLDRIAELEPEATTAEAALREGLELLRRGCEHYAELVEAVRAIVLDTPGLTGQALECDQRPAQWALLVTEALRAEVAAPGLTEAARLKVAEHV